MKTLLAITDPFIKIETGHLAADAAAGSNVALTLINNDNLNSNDFIVVGWEGNELAELCQINQAVTPGTSVRVATLKFNHVAGEPFTKYRYNQRKFYGATAIGGTYAELTAYGSPKTIQVDDPQGTLLEYTDATYTYFKATYFNSTTNEETDPADATATAGDESLRYASLYNIRKHAGLVGNPNYSDLRLETKRAQAENEINSAIFARYVLPLTSVPGLISQICELLAAGYIDYEEFGKDGEGVKWLGEARALLGNITSGTRILIGPDMLELPRQTGGGRLDGQPNSGTPVFDMNDKY